MATRKTVELGPPVPQARLVQTMTRFHSIGTHLDAFRLLSEMQRDGLIARVSDASGGSWSLIDPDSWSGAFAVIDKLSDDHSVRAVDKWAPHGD